MRSISLIFKQFSRSVLLLACFTVWGISAKAQGDAAKGIAIFKANCAGCHAIDKRMTGPALGTIVSSETDDKWLTSWVHNSSALVAAKDPNALDIFNKFGGTVMPGFPSLSDGDVSDILAYVRADWKKLEEAKKTAP
ncbi:MAG: cytochrome c, partial [Mucilaginibacter sp.]|nr:cytochrome c [Mucilaginibacter sp.]